MSKHLPPSSIPFKTGEPVTSSDLIGREEELSRLEHLILGMRQAVAIVAPRRLGKTSLALEFLNRAKAQGYPVAMVDVFLTTDKRKLARDFVAAILQNSRSRKLMKQSQELLKDLLESVSIKGRYGDLEIDFGFRGDLDEEVLLERALAFPEQFAVSVGKTLICFFDEFSEIARLNGDALLKKMRAVFQRQTHVAYIFAGSQTSMMRHIFTHESQAFFRFADIFVLKELNKEAVRIYTLNEFAKLGVSLEGAAVTDILDLTRCHPYYVKSLCKILYFLSLQADRHLRQRDVHLAFEELILSQREYFDEILTRFKEQGRLADVKRLATGEYRFEDIPFDLKYSGLIFLERDTYRFADAILQAYVLRVL